MSGRRALCQDALSAPETIAGSSPDHRADLFAIGIVLYELLTGEHPFATSSSGGTQATLAAITRGEYMPIESLRPDVAAVVSKCIAKCLATNPKQRFQTAGELLTSLDALPPTEVTELDRLVTLVHRSVIDTTTNPSILESASSAAMGRTATVNIEAALDR